jgi:hypothetical protein
MDKEQYSKLDHYPPLSLEDQVIKSLEGTGLIVDNDQQSKYEKERDELLLEPEVIGKSVKSIFCKYASRVIIDETEGFYTPDINFSEKVDDDLSEPVVFISHIPGSPEYFGVVKKACTDNKIDLPWYMVGLEEGKTTIYGDSYKSITEKSELVRFRSLLDYMKDYYAQKVREQADVLNHGRHINIGYNTLAVPDKITYYIKGSHDESYQPVSLEYEVPSLSLEAAVFSFFSQHKDKTPSGQKDAQIVLDRTEITYKGVQIPIETQHLQPLFQELITFDSEENELQKFRRHYLIRTTAN